MTRGSDTLHELLPELGLIKSPTLRRKVAKVWKDAIELGGWKLSDLINIPFTLLIPNCKVNLIEHTRAVTITALKIAEALSDSYGKLIKIDFDILISAALLHDVGKLLEYSKKGRRFIKSDLGELLRHPFSGQALAYKHGLPSEVLHAIAYHSKEGDLGKRTTEAIIIHHADFVNFEPLRG